MADDPDDAGRREVARGEARVGGAAVLAGVGPRQTAVGSDGGEARQQLEHSRVDALPRVDAPRQVQVLVGGLQLGTRSGAHKLVWTRAAGMLTTGTGKSATAQFARGDGPGPP